MYPIYEQCHSEVNNKQTNKVSNVWLRFAHLCVIQTLYDLCFVACQIIKTNKTRIA